ncbi:MAG: cysteine desulfurase [archaeon]
MLDVTRIRQDFPILHSGIVYMDSAASSLTPEPVLQKMMEFYHDYRANIDRGVHRLSQRASQEYDDAHDRVARFINATSSEEIVLTRNSTEGLNIVANGLNWRKGDNVIATLLDHHSNFIIWQRVKNRFGVDLRIVSPDRHGLLHPDDFEKLLDHKTRLVALPHVSNSLGVISPVKEIVRIAKERGALTVIDAAQSIPHMSVDVKELDCDFLAFSGHKMCGPTGSGALYIRDGLAEQVEPTFIGGGTVRDVSLTGYELVKGWRRFEAGTPGIAEGIGLGAAVDYLTTLGMENVSATMGEYSRRLCEGLSMIPQVQLYGALDLTRRIALASFNVGTLSPHDVALALDVSRNIMIRSGHHCALPTMKNVICVEGSARVSLYIYNTRDEIESFLSGVEEISKDMAPKRRVRSSQEKLPNQGE